MRIDGKTIGVVGSRRRNNIEDFEAVRQALASIVGPGDVICSGGCPRGADSFAVALAGLWSLPLLIYPADWKGQGRSAGLIRNTYIAQKSDVLIACVAEDRKGGTEDTITKFKKFHPDGQLILV